MNSMNQSQTRVSLVVGLALACFVVLPNAPAVSPPPDGGYPGFNTAEGENALLSLTNGTYNTALGFLSLQNVTTGARNTGVGAATLVLNNGVQNTAIGAGALLLNTTGSDNTAAGFFALVRNTTGDSNTANGANALAFNTTGSENTAIGNGALFNNTESGNTANGANALFANTTGIVNTAMGRNALATNIAGAVNTAIGNDAVRNNTTGDSNTAVGNGALRSLNTGVNNTAVGDRALVGNTGSFNTALGFRAGSDLTTGQNNIDIGFGVLGVAGESNTIRIGHGQDATFIAGISGATAAGGAAVFVTPNGHLGTTTSSARFKDEIKPMADASEAILALRPVSFRYKKEIDPQGFPEFGLVAEEVEKVNPALVIRDPEGRPYTVRYEQVNAMLLNEFLKEHRKVQEQDATIAQVKSTAAKQEATIAQQQKQIEALTAGLQKVSHRLARANSPQDESAVAD